MALSQWDDSATDLLRHFQTGSVPMYVLFDGPYSRTKLVVSYYNWTPYTQGGGDLGYEFVPMFKTDEIEKFQERVVPGYGKHILGFNE